jgi:LacI family transcriptional regulator
MVRKNKVSIYTISEELGISPGTVSRALSNHPSISAETRARVKPVAEKYGFKPRLVSTKPLNICMLIQKVQGHPLGFDEYVSLTMEGAAEYCEEEGLEMSIYSSSAEAMNECDIVRELRRRTANGAIIIRATDGSEYIQQMNTQRFPYFNLTPRPQGKKFSDCELTLDNEKVGYIATKHLLSLGHRRIGIICDTKHATAVMERYKGYVRALSEENIPLDEKLVYTNDPVTTSFKILTKVGADGMKTLWSRAPEMTAVLAEDKIANGAMTWLQMNHVVIPDQISVVGISDYPTSEYLYPPLTTVHVPYKAMGYEAARQVHRLCRGMDVYLKDDVLDDFIPKLVIRKSTGPVRK